MFFGIICGLGAALLNSLSFLASAGFIKKFKSSVSMLIYAQIWMLLLSLPVVLCFFPGKVLSSAGLHEYIVSLIFWLVVFFSGQGCLFIAQRYMESSKLSSLLGLKIIVLTLIFMFTKHVFPNYLQWIAVFMAAGAGVIMNWNGKINFGGRGMIFVGITLVCYSLSDINETNMVLFFVNNRIATMKSALIATTTAYTAMGLASLPWLFFIQRDRKQFLSSFGYAFPWLLSQIILLACFARLLPVFGNVLLSMRGVFSVLFGMILSYIGIYELDAKTGRQQWILRWTAAFLMILAVALYSYATM